MGRSGISPSRSWRQWFTVLPAVVKKWRARAAPTNPSTRLMQRFPRKSVCFFENLRLTFAVPQNKMEHKFVTARPLLVCGFVVQTSTTTMFEWIMKAIIDLLLIVWLCSLPRIVLAQTEDPHEAQPERPTVATHAGTVAPGWLEIEARAELDHYDDHSQGIGLPVTIKIGVTSNTQFSVFASGVQPSSDKDFQAGDLAFGLKWRLADDLPILGRFAVLPSIKLPTGSQLRRRNTEPSMEVYY